MANFLLSKKRFHALKIERISISRLLLPFSDYDSHVLFLEKKFIMHKFNRLLVLSLPLLLISCAPASEDSASVSLSSSEPSASSSTESTSEDYSKWTEDQKILMKNYADGVLPYPSGFKGEVTFDVATDEASDSVFLQIFCKAEEFGIASYYESLVKDGWSVIRDYNGNPEQSDSKVRSKATPKAMSITNSRRSTENLVTSSPTSITLARTPATTSSSATTTSTPSSIAEPRGRKKKKRNSRQRRPRSLPS